MGSVFKRPLSILSSRPKHCFKQWITGLSPHRARSPGGERVSPKVVRIGVGRQVRWQDLQSGRKSSGATWSRSASTMAELGVGPQVRWRDLEPDYKSGGETCGQTGPSLTASLATGLVVRLQVSPPDLRADSKFRHRTCTSTPSRATGLAA